MFKCDKRDFRIMTELEFCSIENRLTDNGIGCLKEARFALAIGLDGVIKFLPIQEMGVIANNYIPLCEKHKKEIQQVIKNIKEKERENERLKNIKANHKRT